MTQIKNKSSFRDPNGFIFTQNGEVFRQINNSYKENYDYLISSGLYKKLTDNFLLIKHEEIETNILTDSYKTIKPEKIPFISYPYEWCFSQLKDAALLTLKILKESLKHNMILKDSSLYNIQFIGYNPIFIDTLSFEKYKEGEPWAAYFQFCQHFLSPLSLMSKKDVRLNNLLKTYIDGIPLSLTSNLLPKSSYFDFQSLIHIHLHKKYQDYSTSNVGPNKKYFLSKKNLIQLIEGIENYIYGMNYKLQKTSWSNYYSSEIYTNNGIGFKKEIVDKYIKSIAPKSIWDMGANNGLFSFISAKNKINTLAIDSDFSCTEEIYTYLKKNDIKHVLPLHIDLSNPSPSIGWNNEERSSFFNREHPDMILSLALIHHLRITNGIPLKEIVDLTQRLCNYLIIEYIPKDDKQIALMLKTRKDIYDDYSQENFELEFNEFYTTIEKSKIPDSNRLIYVMRKK